MEVVGVQVGHERHVRAPGLRRRHRPPPAAQVGEPAYEQGIGQHADVRVLDRAGGVTPPRELHRHLFASFARLPAAYVQE